MIKNVIFDWSGVIGDDSQAVFKTIMTILQKYGVNEMSFEQFRKDWEQPYMRFYKRYGISWANHDEEEALYRGLYKTMAAQYPPKAYPNIKDALLKFKAAGLKMIVLSSNLTETILADMRDFGLEGIFDEVNNGIHDKAEAIHEILVRNNFNPKETIFIGDTAHEVEAGKAGGTKTGAVTWGYNDEERLKAANPDFIIHNLEELESVILK
jgi:phosphoglycolate phosphatase